MRSSIIIVINILLVLLIPSCSKDSEPTNVNQQPNRTELLNYSFEKTGLGFLEGWRVNDTLLNKNISFSSDVPATGGNYSLSIQADSIKSTYLSYTIIPLPSTLKKIFKLSYSQKRSVSTSFLATIDIWIYTSNGVEGGYGSSTIKANQWINLSSATDMISSQVDSLVLGLSVPSIKPSEHFLFDMVNLVEEEYK